MVGLIAHAPIDVIAQVSDDLLPRYALRRHGCTTLSRSAIEALEAEVTAMGTARFLPGGCGANQAAWLARMGGAATVVAPFGNDTHGRTARADLTARGVAIAGFDYAGPHTLVYTLVTPDRDRSFADDDHGVRYDLFPAARALANERLVAIDGYLLLRPGAPEGIAAYLAEVAPRGQEILFCPGDVSVIELASGPVRALVERCDHLLLNHGEAAALFPGRSMEEIVALLRARGTSGAVTLAEKGALLFNPGGVFHAPPARLSAPIVNTNGAGDGFAGGYMHAVARGLSLEEIARAATLCAGEALLTEGARPLLSPPFSDQ